MPYTRSTSAKSRYTQVQANKQWNGSSWVPLASSLSLVYDYTSNNVRSGDRVVDYQSRIRAGIQAGSPYTLEANRLEKVREGKCDFIVQDYFQHPMPSRWKTSYWQSFSGLGQNPNLIPTSHLPTALAKADAAALKKTYSKVRSEYQHMNALASIAEFGDVIRQFGAPFASIVDLTNRRLNRLELAKRGLSGSTSFRRIKYAEIVASTYLEYAFGLAPLIKDTKDAAEALARYEYELAGEAKFRARVRSRGLDTAVAHTDLYSSATLSPLIFRHVTKKTTECRVQYICGLSTSFHANYGANNRLLRLLGFDPMNVIPAAWEAVPWSWLVDYFANVSDILDAAATTTTGINWINKTVTYRTVTNVMSRYDEAATAKFLPASRRVLPPSDPNLGSYDVVRTTLERSLPLSLGVPPLVLEHPFENAKKLANMAAVLISRRPSSSALWLT